MRLIHVFGLPRSGTTLLQKLVSSSKSTVSLPETWFRLSLNIFESSSSGFNEIGYSACKRGYDDFIKKTKESKEVLECHSVTGRGSHMLKIRVKNSQAFEDLLYEIQNWPGVSRTRSNVVLSTYKETTEINLLSLKEKNNIN